MHQWCIPEQHISPDFCNNITNDLRETVNFDFLEMFSEGAYGTWDSRESRLILRDHILRDVIPQISDLLYGTHESAFIPEALSQHVDWHSLTSVWYHGFIPGLTYTDTDRFQWHETSKSCLSVFVCRLYWNCPQVDDRNTRVWLEQSLIYAGRDHMFSVSGD